MLQACLNGSRGKEFHEATPLTPDDLARDATRVVDAGATELHLHPRNAGGAETLAPVEVAAALDAVRAAVPGIPIGLSTHAGIAPGGQGRLDAVAAWRTKPDYVSVNLIEDDASEMIALCLSRGIGVEAGIWSVADAERFVKLPEARKCLRILIEINEQDVAEGLAAAAAIRLVLARASLDVPILQHGFEASVWPLYQDALMRGLDGRIGLEDGRDLPDGMIAKDNTDLIKAAFRLSRQPPNLPPEVTPSIARG
ncbi:3-keto-5-aminohexanoate cleavage protein [Ancylobacter sp. 6x-1]|uniref:3-keto-5-aminohexanoate cleavage protein n=1 Tax=Ancylobacter crimeensis TaxID=2579147 RepID=A0ABT0D9T4_9HYPH|nr:3-keto-5-aminohexanoate cleavage protein [Ancylobacter crimeensis]MCK0196713.1 3-keto-5-aminohexanoate cleavage protein [Ancylobacter crimeensis]